MSQSLATALRHATIPMLLSTAAFGQQAPNLLSPLSAWTVVTNPSHVTATVLTDRISFVASCNHQLSPVSVSTTFTVSQAGPHILWLDAIWSIAPGSREIWTWSIPGVGSDSWYQDYDVLSRDVAQWLVDLPAGTHTLTATADSWGCGTIGHVYNAELRTVSGPQVVPDRVYYDPLGALYTTWGDFTIENRTPLPSPVYLVFLSNNTLSAPVTWPFGDQWLDNPLYLGALNTPSWTPTSPAAAWAAYSMLHAPFHSPQWWQVVEYDVGAPLSTLNLGSPNRTSKGHL